MTTKTKTSKTAKKPAAPSKAPGAAPAPTPAKATKAKQLKLPAEGMARKTNPEIDAAAERYRVARDVRMEHTKAEKQAKANLLEVAKKHGITAYVYESEDGEEFEVEYLEKQDEDVKVRKVKPDTDEDE